MTSPAIVNRYANALVDIVLSASSGIDPALAVSQLRSFEEALHTAPELGTALASPAVPAARKRQVIRRIADALGFDRIVRNFLLVLSDHYRAAALPEMIRAFEVLADERLGFLHAEVVSASELTEPHREQLAVELGKLAASRIRMKFVVDPNLIGGVTARIGSKVYDGSVRGRLAILQRRLAVGA
jgi:F-type H+-transporting ATPase subunit delta